MDPYISTFQRNACQRKFASSPWMTWRTWSHSPPNARHDRQARRSSRRAPGPSRSSRPSHRAPAQGARGHHADSRRRYRSWVALSPPAGDSPRAAAPRALAQIRCSVTCDGREDDDNLGHAGAFTISGLERFWSRIRQRHTPGLPAHVRASQRCTRWRPHDAEGETVRAPLQMSVCSTGRPSPCRGGAGSFERDRRHCRR